VSLYSQYAQYASRPNIENRTGTEPVRGRKKNSVQYRATRVCPSKLRLPQNIGYSFVLLEGDARGRKGGNKTSVKDMDARFVLSLLLIVLVEALMPVGLPVLASSRIPTHFYQPHPMRYIHIFAARTKHPDSAR